MNMHCPQTWASRAELNEIMHVNEQIVSAQGNRPVIGAVQDTVSGAFIMTWKDTFFTKEEFQQLMIEVHYADNFPMPPPAICYPCERWTGKQIASYLLPTKLYFSRVVRNGTQFDPMDPKERTVVVNGGQLLCGSLCKRTIGTSELGFVHLICQDISNIRANQFLSDLSRCVASFFRDYGFSIGIGDCVTSEATQNKIHETLESIFQSVQQLEDPTDERKVFPLLQKALEKTGKIVMNSLDKTNNIYNCVTSGAKGSNLNLGQIMGCVGQQAINGGRIAPNPRSLPSFFELDKDPNAKGFVSNSYLLGLNAEEFFFHMMGGREGMIDTAVKTASTGYIQRKLTKYLESLVVQQDSTIRDSVGNIMGLVYGGDGYDARYLETVKLPVLRMSNTKVQETYPKFDERTLCRVLEMRSQLQAMRVKGTYTVDCKYRLPVNIARLIRIEKRAESKFATWEDVLQFEATLGDNLPMRLHLLCSCAHAKKIPFSIFELVQYRMERALVAPGEAVGLVASTSIGEPTTQVSFRRPTNT